MESPHTQDPLDPAARAELARRRTRRGLAPELAVALELLRALLAVVLAPLHLVWHALRAKARRAEVRALLGARDEPAPVPVADADAPPPHLFVSCAEPSGEIHARALAARLARTFGPGSRLSGLGGPALAALGVRTVGDPVSRARMGFGVVLALGFYLRLLTNAARHLRDERPDAAVLVDSPALHVPLGRLARRYGVPVVHFVTPQYWGWAPWRVRGYRSAVDLALSILPFERRWFEARGIACAHVGHPLLDRLSDVPHRGRPVDEGPIALLPGSRASVIERNLPWMLATLAGAAPSDGLDAARYEVLLGRADLAERVRAVVAASPLAERVEVVVGDLHRRLPACRAALTVSGTVVLDVAHHRLPMVVLYRLSNRLEVALLGRLLTVPHFASVNLLAGEEVVPEFGFAGEGPRAAVAAALGRLARPGEDRERALAGLARALARVGDAGAVERAAAFGAAVARPRTAPDGGPDPLTTPKREGGVKSRAPQA